MSGMKKYAFTPDKREELIDGLEANLTEDFVRAAQRRNRAWINLNESVRVYPSEIIELQDGAYNPNGWNEYPEVTPPTGVWMRTERHTAEGVVRSCLIFSSKDGGFWHDGSDVHQCDRFRPWDD